MKRRDVLLAISGFGAIALSSRHAVASVQELTPIQLPEGFQYPNGITRAQDGALYVGTILNGRILRIQPNGKTDMLFQGNDDIFAVTSLRLDETRNILWGSSPDVLGTPQTNGEIVRRPHRIFAIDIRTGQVLHIILMPDEGFGNDIALDMDGGIYVTDTVRPRIHYLASGKTRFEIWAEDVRFSTQFRFGLSGIARREDGVLFVTKYSDGQLFKVTPSRQGAPTVEEIQLPRKIDGADAIQLIGDSLLMVEGGIENGDGRLLQLRGFEAGSKPELQVLASGMNLPVNLTVAGREVWLTESLFRHRLVSGQEEEIPNQFFIRHFVLPEILAIAAK